MSSQAHELQGVRVLEYLHCGITMLQFIQPFSVTERCVAEQCAAKGQGLKAAGYQTQVFWNAQCQRGCNPNLSSLSVLLTSSASLLVLLY